MSTSHGKSDGSRGFRNAVVVLANYRQFTKGEEIRQRDQLSVMLLWRRAGSGRVTANDESFALDEDGFYILPWGRRLAYAADRTSPYDVGCIHVIPDHGRAAPVQLFMRPQALSDTSRALRRDVPLTRDGRVVRGRFANAPSLRHLADYIVTAWHGGPVAERVARQFGQLLCREWCLYLSRSGPSPRPFPRALQGLLLFARRHLDGPLSLSDLVRASGLSAATVGRLFRRHLRVTPVTWIRRQRVEQAQSLLSSTTLSVTEIGLRVGIEDVYYFSRMFKEVSGLTPSAYRRRTRAI